MAKGISLHIGLNKVDPNHYQGWSGPLNACEADAEDMQFIAKDQNYKSKILLTSKATRNAVESGIQSASGQLNRGDIFFLSYSGHGGQIPDKDGDERDLQDETWCLFDGQLIDDELHLLFSEFKPGVRILVLSDSCHSGSVTKSAYDGLVASGLARGKVSRVEGDETPVFRTSPDEVSLRTFRANRKFYMDIMSKWPKKKPSIKASVQLISGCQDNQLSLDGTFNGLFTGTLLRVWADGVFKGNYTQFHKAILRLMPSTQSPNHFLDGKPDTAFNSQRPFQI